MRVIDLHAHASPGAYAQLSSSMGGSHENRFAGFSDDFLSLDRRIEMMDEAEVEQQVLSPMVAPYSDDRKASDAAAALINDHYADLMHRYPDRFAYWASLPLPHIDESLAELRRCLDDNGARGVVLGCYCLGDSIADPKFEPVYEELDSRGATIFLHPCQNGAFSPQINDWGLTVCVGASVEDSLAALQLVINKIPSRFPRIRFVVPHFGGILPMLLNRLDGQMNSADLAEPPSVTVRRFYFDTVGWGSKAALNAAIDAFGPSQIVTGSDFPVLLHYESYKTTFDHIRECDHGHDVAEQILGNGRELLRERR